MSNTKKKNRTELLENVVSLNLYKLKGTASGAATYNCAIVAAFNQEDARKIHPDMRDSSYYKETGIVYAWDKQSWAPSPEDVTVILLGVAASWIKEGVISTDFDEGFQ